MENLKHTKGEWKILAENDDLSVVCENGRQRICQLPPKYSYSQENAKLISAAPELLEALINLYKCNLNGEAQKDNWIKAINAINKAIK